MGTREDAADGAGEGVPDPEALAAGSSLTARQVEVLARREAGATQREIADEFGTTASNVSRIERAAEANVEKARRTLEVARVLRAPARVRAERGERFDDLIDAVYDRGDEAGIRIDYCRPELYAHLYAHLEDRVSGNAFVEPAEVGISEAGEVTVVEGREG